MKIGLAWGLLSAAIGLIGCADQARAGGWLADRDDCAPCTRHAQAEWLPALRHAQCLAQMNCAELAHYAEGTRFQANLRALSTHGRPMIPATRVANTEPAPVTFPTPPSMPSSAEEPASKP